MFVRQQLDVSGSELSRLVQEICTDTTGCALHDKSLRKTQSTFRPAAQPLPVRSLHYLYIF